MTIRKGKLGALLFSALLILSLVIGIFPILSTTVLAADGEQAPVLCTTCNTEDVYYENGICTHVAGAKHYQAAELNNNNTADSTDDYYEIGNAGQLYWFAGQINSGNSAINGRLTANIDLNPGFTFTFIPDTGLVELKKDNAVVAYLGTGMAGESLSENNSSTFDSTASEMHAIYADTSDNVADDVSLAGLSTWVAMGSSDTGYNYSGSFDGGGHTVSGVYISNTDFYQGFFSFVANGGAVRGVTITNSFISGNNRMGGVVGFKSADSVLEDCTNAGIVIGQSYIGGVVGELYGDIDGCVNAGIVISSRHPGTSQNTYIGGVVGNNNYSSSSGLGTMTDCHNTGSVYTDSVGSSLGGIVGQNGSNCKIYYCSNSGTVRGAKYAGGITGINYSATIENCYNTGTVFGYQYVGGITGQNSSNSAVKSCYSAGAVSYDGSGYIGGIIGDNYSSGTVSGCYYLAGTANGGIEGSDVEGQAVVKSAEAFTGGEVAYLLNGGVTDGTQIWYQTLGTETPSYPSLKRVYDEDGVTVTNTVYLAEPCPVYSNSTEAEHTFSQKGLCTGCNEYQAATDGDGDGYYEIGNIGQLYWLADKVNNDNENYRTVKVILTDNIELNPGYSFTFLADSGLVEVAKEGTAVAYLGTGIPGDKSGKVDSFDAYASEMGSIYGTDLAVIGTGDVNPLASLNVWTPIGTVDARFEGIFHGARYSISGIYVNDSSAENVGLFGLIDNEGSVGSVTVTDSYLRGKHYVGGVAGINYGNITSCGSNATVLGDRFVGGVVGQNKQAELVASYSSGVVAGTTLGGVAAINEEGSVNACYFTGSIYSTDSYTTVGGVVGGNIPISGDTNAYAFVTGCYTTGLISGDLDPDLTGYVVGFNASIVDDCYYLADSESDLLSGTTAMTAAEFASGKVAYILNYGETVGQLWFQTLGEGGDPSPVLHGIYDYDLEAFTNVVYPGSVCPAFYSNSPDNAVDHKHENGICIYCEGYVVPETVTDDESSDYYYDALGLTEEYVGYYVIENAGNLYWFAALINGDVDVVGDTAQDTDANAILISNIDLNPGYTFTFIPDTGLVKVEFTEGSGEDEVTAVVGYLGTGIAGSEVKDGSTQFDSAASEPGRLYSYNTSLKRYSLVEGELDGPRAWVPIGDMTHFASGFGGVFDGNGKTVSGIYINGDSDYVALFGMTLELGLVMDVRVENGYIGGLTNVASIVALNHGTVEDCHNSCALVSAIESGGIGGVVGSNHGRVSRSSNISTIGDTGTNVGGVVGDNYGSIDNCYNTGDVSGKYNVGGVVGYNDGKLEDVYNTGDVCGEDNVGGIVGYGIGDIHSSYNTGDVSGKNYVGGITGYIASGSIYSCYNEGDTSVTAENGVAGGIAGAAGSAMIEASYNMGDVTALEAYSRIGGIVGEISSGTVQNVYNLGSVTAKGISSVAGGLAGSLNANLCFSFNAGNVSGLLDEESYIGAIIGYGSSLYRTYYLRSNSVNSSLLGVGDSYSDQSEAVAVNAAVLASGGVAYLMNDSVSTPDEGELLAWYQLLGEDGDPMPTLHPLYDENDDTRIVNVVYQSTVCPGLYSNEEGYNAEHEHVNGICLYCEAYVVPEMVTDDESSDYYYGALGLTEDYVGYYVIENAGNLYWFAALVNGDISVIGEVAQAVDANAILISNIDLNPGYTFTFIPDTGLVKVEFTEGSGKDEVTTVVGYLGTGVAGLDVKDGDTRFDSVSSEPGVIYVYDEDEGYTVIQAALDALRTWTPIGDVDVGAGFEGILDGNGKTVKGMYINKMTYSPTGFIGENRTGSVMSLSIANGYVNTTTFLSNGRVDGGQNVGAVVGLNGGRVEGCLADVTVVGMSYVGGVVGYNSREVINSENSGTVIGAILNSESGNSFIIGGIVGVNAGFVSGCSNSGTVIGEISVGGIAGENYGTIECCTNSGSVVGIPMSAAWQAPAAMARSPRAAIRAISADRTRSAVWSVRTAAR